MTIRAELAAALLLTAVFAAVASAQPSDPVRLYNEAMTRETAVRVDLTNPAVRDAATTKRRLRTLVGAYTDLARLFPASGVGDKALWQGGLLAADAFWQWQEPVDRATALRVFEVLRTTYPVSTLTRQSQPHVKRLSDAPVADLAVARSPAPAVLPAIPPATSAPAAVRSTPVPAAAPAPSRPAPVAEPDPAPATPGATALLTAIRHEPVAGAMRVTLEIDRETAFKGERLDNPARVFVDLQQTRTLEPLRDAVIPVTSGGVQRIRVGRHPGGLIRVVLDLTGTARHSVYPLYNPYRIVIDVEAPAGQATAAPAPRPAASSLSPAGPRPIVARAAVRPRAAAAWPAPVATARRASLGVALEPPAASAPDAMIVPAVVAAAAPLADLPAPVTPAATARGDYSLSRQLGLGIARIVIDAGHGGHDPGARVRGLTEASLTLDIALRLEELLRKQPGVEVVQTRRKDAYVSLDDRIEIANRAGADLFIAIHANASNNPRTRGVETYVLNFAGDAQAERVAARENASSGRTMRELPDIVKAIALNDKVDESREFARFVQDSLFGQLRKNDKTLRNLGVKQAPFMVLIGATMPSVLTEVAFVTNREDAGLLRSEKYRQDVAQALLAGITRYQQSLKRAPAVAAQ
jgi:N-acetylmuramoyl-L-alanine amidase